jgi:hypothetical protein
MKKPRQNGEECVNMIIRAPFFATCYGQVEQLLPPPPPPPPLSQDDEDAGKWKEDEDADQANGKRFPVEEIRSTTRILGCQLVELFVAGLRQDDT